MDSEELPIGFPPSEALDWFRAKGFVFGFAWQDVWHEEHGRAFTVAKAMTRDVLETIREAVDRAIADGETLSQFQKALRPRLEQLGWWGRQRMIDPATGQSETVQLGSPRRLKTIFQVNMRTSYAAGRWERIQRNRRAFPLLEYVSVKDGREREEHGAWHGTVLPVEDAWWETHFPPNGWNCRCIVRPVSRGQARRRGLEVNKPVSFPSRQWVNKRTGEVHRIEEGLDPGWAYHVGKARHAGLTPGPLDNGGLAAMTALSPGDDKHVRLFCAAFGLADVAAAIAGRTYVDAGGWPVAIAASWFRNERGQAALPGGVSAADLVDVAKAIMSPSEIRWLWVASPSIPPQLVRRYFGEPDAEGNVMVVDLARWWRARRMPAQRVASLRVGQLAWSPATGVAAYDPSQPRHAKGVRGAGQWRSSGRSAARASLLGKMDFFPKAIFGQPSEQIIALADSNGIDLRGKGIVLIHTQAVHILAHHGPGREKRRNQVPVTGRDILNAPKLLNSATEIEVGYMKRDNRPRFLARTGSFETSWEVSKKSVTLISMHRKK